MPQPERPALLSGPPLAVSPVPVPTKEMLQCSPFAFWDQSAAATPALHHPTLTSADTFSSVSFSPFYRLGSAGQIPFRANATRSIQLPSSSDPLLKQNPQLSDPRSGPLRGLTPTWTAGRETLSPIHQVPVSAGSLFPWELRPTPRIPSPSMVPTILEYKPQSKVFELVSKSGDSRSQINSKDRSTDSAPSSSRSSPALQHDELRAVHVEASTSKTSQCKPGRKRRASSLGPNEDNRSPSQTSDTGRTSPPVDTPPVYGPNHRIPKAEDAAFICPRCGKKFNRPSSLRIHVFSHTGLM